MNKDQIKNFLSNAALFAGSTFKMVLENLKEGITFLVKILAPEVVKGYKEKRDFLMTPKEKFNKQVKEEMLKIQAKEEAERRLQK